MRKYGLFDPFSFIVSPSAVPALMIENGPFAVR